VRSIARLTGTSIVVPCFSILSRRSAGLKLRDKRRQLRDEPVHLVVDATGLSVFGAGERFEEKHKIRRKRRTWRKLHLGLDLVSGEILCADLSGRTPGRLIRVFADWPMVSAPMAEEKTSASRAAVQRNLDTLVRRGLIREVTGQGRYKVWAAALA
jgi:hypothetical protein